MLLRGPQCELRDPDTLENTRVWKGRGVRKEGEARWWKDVPGGDPYPQNLNFSKFTNLMKHNFIRLDFLFKTRTSASRREATWTWHSWVRGRGEGRKE